jgi:uncharacterized protein (TIGR00299 family) protein
MRIAYLECFSGISGDMFLGALVDAGVPAKLLQDTVSGLSLGAMLEVSRVMRSGISATKVDVWVNDEKDLPKEEYWSEKRAQNDLRRETGGHSHQHETVPHEHSHEHSHEPSSEHRYSSAHDHTHGHSHGRGLIEIRKIISASGISVSAKQTACAMFEALGTAEGKIHNVPPEEVHFHEVGAVDAIVDIICAAVGVEALGADQIVCSPLNLGGGTVHCAHGTFPVPAPATLELLKGAPTYSSEVQKELVTPTGAAIVKTLARQFGAFPRMKIEATGYGAGSRDFAGHPNVLRLTLGEALSEPAGAAAGKTTSEMIIVLEANLDDLNPQVFGYAMDRLLEAGALDVFAMPVQMKKNRPGMLLTALCRPEDADKLMLLIFAETTTLGVRRREEARQILARRWESVNTQWGEVRIKIGSMNGTVSNYAPEYEDCRRIASIHRVPLKIVMGEAVESYLHLSKK